MHFFKFIFISFSIVCGPLAFSEGTTRRPILSQFAVLKIEDFSYFSSDVLNLLVAVPVAKCTLGEQSMIEKWFPQLSKGENWPKVEKEINSFLQKQNMNEILFLGKLIKFEADQSLDFKMTPTDEKKWSSCLQKYRNRLNVLPAEALINHEKDLDNSSRSIISFHYFIIDHYQKMNSPQDKKDENKNLQSFFDSINKKYSHDLYKF